VGDDGLARRQPIGARLALACLFAGTSQASGRQDMKSTTYEFFIFAISILSIANMTQTSRSGC